MSIGTICSGRASVPTISTERYERFDLAFERSDWIPTAAAQALIRNNRPLLAYIAGKPASVHEQGPQFPARRNGREADRRDQQLAARPSPATAIGRWLCRRPSPAGKRSRCSPASRSESRSRSNCRNRCRRANIELRASMAFSDGADARRSVSRSTCCRNSSQLQRSPRRSLCSIRKAKPARLLRRAAVSISSRLPPATIWRSSTR